MMTVLECRNDDGLPAGGPSAVGKCCIKSMCILNVGDKSRIFVVLFIKNVQPQDTAITYRFVRNDITHILA